MRLDHIKDFVERYRLHLDAVGLSPDLYLWECQMTFNRHWQLESDDFGKMFDKALSHHSVRRLWKGNFHSPKSMMLGFIEVNPSFVKASFQDLLNDQRDLILRIERFHSHCDEMLNQLAQFRTKINHHAHEGFYMPTVYLSLMYPSKYMPYLDGFSKVLRMVKAKDPQLCTLDRYYKVSRLLHNQLLNNPSIKMSLDKALFSVPERFKYSMWITYCFVHFILQLEGHST